MSFRSTGPRCHCPHFIHRLPPSQAPSRPQNHTFINQLHGYTSADCTSLRRPHVLRVISLIFAILLAFLAIIRGVFCLQRNNEKPRCTTSLRMLHFSTKETARYVTVTMLTMVC